MLIDFFLHLKERRVPVTITEYLALIKALQAGLGNCSMDDFYALSRICLVKNEAHYDRFDVVFSDYFEKIGAQDEDGIGIPEEWLKNGEEGITAAEALAARDILSAEPPAQTDDATVHEERPRDGKSEKMTGSNLLGMNGINPESVRMDSAESVVKKRPGAWDSREFRALDDELELGTRNIRIALRRLRRFAREGAPDELDLEESIHSTAKNAGWLDLVMRPERRNRVKVLLLFDTGGSMTPHIKQCEELFSAARSEFKHMDCFYFHNCVYDTVWKYEGTSFTTHYPVHYLNNKFGRDYRLILVGDASMGPTEISDPGAVYLSTPNTYSGETGMKILLAHFRHAVWLNPEQERFWRLTQSIGMIREIMENRMFPLTLRGLDEAMRSLGR